MKPIQSDFQIIPTVDKVFLALGVPATITVPQLNQYLGLAVAALTVLVLIPRALIGWAEFLKRRKDRDK